MSHNCLPKQPGAPGSGCSTTPSVVDTHPCFSEPAHHVYARMHLAVAPKCNIKCNYCNRLYDCPNESRPGVTSDVLTPEEAVVKVGAVLKRVPNLTVVGIAGPGDPLANDATIETLHLVHQAYPQLTLCISTNGLALPDRIDELVDAHVLSITVTANAVDPDIGEQIYGFVRYRGKTYRGRQAAALLLDQQRKGIEAAVKRGMAVKINSVMIPDINADHLVEVAQMARRLGAHTVNIMPLIPVAGTRFADFRPPTPAERKRLQDLCELDIKQMRHCRQCRADAIGLLGEDLSSEFTRAKLFPSSCAAASKRTAAPPPSFREGPAHQRIRVAVTSKDGQTVNQHFGHAGAFLIYEVRADEIALLESRHPDGQEDSEGCGERAPLVRQIIEALRDCRAIITSHMGPRTRQEFWRAGILPVETYEAIDPAIRSVVQSLSESDAIDEAFAEGRLV